MSDESALVLVVDDNEMNRDMLSRRLQRQKYIVSVAEDGEQALEMVQDQPYDLILLDIMMPKLSGYDVLERLKSDDKTRHIPVIMISAVDDLDSVVRCIELGAEDYLFKPFNPVLLKARVGASLRKNARMSVAGLAPHVNAIAATVEMALAQDELDTVQKDHLEKIQTHLATIQKMLDA